MSKSRDEGRIREIGKAFLILGLTSFGGPVAHLGYFHAELVARRKWLNEQSYADLVALCQFLPGPASSQVGFALGLHRGGFAGALTAWAAFTMPSVLLLLIFAYSASALGGVVGHGVIHGLKLVAVAVVAQAVWGMARQLCPDFKRLAIAIAALFIVVLLTSALSQMAAIGLGALLGWWWCKTSSSITSFGHFEIATSKATAKFVFFSFFTLLLGLPLLLILVESQGLALFESFYRAGALVFGGGHVVLPLLESSVVESGWISQDQFLAGYGAAQALPGPLFTFAAYLGAIVAPEPNGFAGATIALIAIFLPGMLLLLGVLPYWEELRKKQNAKTAMAGANAAVVGILAAALYDPVWRSAVLSPMDFMIVLIAFVSLTLWKVAPWKIVLATTLAGAGTFIGF